MQRSLTSRALALSIALVIPLLGCVVPSSPAARTTPHTPPSEADIRLAVTAEPAATAPFALAVFANHVEEDLDIAPGLREIPGVASVQRVPRRFMATADEPVGTLVSDLRMHAAQMNSDLILVIDFVQETDMRPNGWYALSPLLLPLLFTPWITQDVEATLHWYLVDVQTGAYVARGRASSEPTTQRSTIYRADDHLDEMGVDHQAELLGQMTGDLKLLFAAWATAGRAAVVEAPVGSVAAPPQ